MPVCINAEFDCEKVGAKQILRKQIGHDLQWVGLGSRLWHWSQQDFQQTNLQYNFFLANHQIWPK